MLTFNSIFVNKRVANNHIFIYVFKEISGIALVFSILTLHK